MGKKIDIDELAKLAGVTRSAVYLWRDRYSDFPAPVDPSAKRGARYDKAEVKAFLELHSLGAEHARERDAGRSRAPRGSAVRGGRVSGRSTRDEGARNAWLEPAVAAIATLAFADRDDRVEARLLDDIADGALRADDEAGTRAIAKLAARIAERDPSLGPVVVCNRPIASLSEVIPPGTIRSLVADPAGAPKAVDHLIDKSIAYGPWLDPRTAQRGPITRFALQVPPAAPTVVLDANAAYGATVATAMQDGLEVLWREPDADLRGIVLRRVAVHELAGGRAREITRGSSARADVVSCTPLTDDGKDVDWQEVVRLRGRVRPGGRLVAVVPAPVLAQCSGAPRDLVADEAVEAVITLAERQRLRPLALVVLMPPGEPSPRILFARATRDVPADRVAQLVADARSGLEPGVIADADDALEAALVPAVDVLGAHGGESVDLAPVHWTAHSRLGDGVRAFDDAASAQGQVDTALRRLPTSIGDVRAVQFDKVLSLIAPTARPLGDLMTAAAPLVEQLRSLPVPDLATGYRGPSSNVPVARIEASGAVRLDGKPIQLPDLRRPDGEYDLAAMRLALGDVVVWSGRDTAFRTYVVEGAEANGDLVAVEAARVLRITAHGTDCGLTPELLALVIEASGVWFERSATRQNLRDVRIPSCSPGQSPEECVRAAAAQLGALAEAVADVRRAEHALTIAASRVGYLRIVLAEYGGAGSLDVWSATAGDA